MITVSIPLNQISRIVDNIRFSDLTSLNAEFFDSPIILISYSSFEGGVKIWVGDNVDPLPDIFDEVQNYRGILTCEGLVITLSNKNSHGLSVKVIRTGSGGTPIYCSHEDDVLHISWKFDYTVRSLKRPEPDYETCRLYLQHGQCQTREQVISGVYMLWPMDGISFSENGLRFFDTLPIDITQPTPLNEHAHVIEAWQKLISNQVLPLLSRSYSPIIELSGGYDSSCVALSIHELHSNLSSYSLIHDGPIGNQQVKRRDELINLVKSHDFEYPSYQHSAIYAVDHDEYTLTPFDDCYRMSCVNAVDAHPCGPFDLLITGIGGDELTLEDTYKRLDFEIDGIPSASALVSAFGRADMFMRRGIWPTNPLVNPLVVNFCRSLPKEMRNHRMLNILHLAKCGISEGFLFPRYSEHYGNFLARDAAQADYDTIFRESVIADLRIADVSAIMDEARRATRYGISLELATRLLTWAKLDAILKSYV